MAALSHRFAASSRHCAKQVCICAASPPCHTIAAECHSAASSALLHKHTAAPSSLCAIAPPRSYPRGRYGTITVQYPQADMRPYLFYPAPLPWTASQKHKRDSTTDTTYFSWN
eukprot:6212729-Pleurochrysis_carterae.AAC.1